MTGTIGNLTLLAATVVAAAGLFASVAAGRAGEESTRARRLTVARSALAAAAAFFGVSAVALGWALFRADLSLDYVEKHVEVSMPGVLRVAALWSGQEGSLLLWAALTGAAGSIAALGRRKLRGPGEAGTLAVFAAMSLLFGILLLSAASPFRLAPEIESDGRGLHPQLQHWAMTVHPPLVLAGYAAFTVPFAIAFGAMLARRRDAGWTGELRRWTLAAWTVLGAGMALGAWWAYAELGWGGYWAWDPVENASLMPWLSATALVHSIGAQRRSGGMTAWVAALAMTTFGLCLFGTYLTRSGIVQSIHTFAASEVGHVLIGLLAAMLIASLVAWARGHESIRMSAVRGGPTGSDDRLAIAANVLLLIMVGATLAGTVIPVLSGPLVGTPVGLTSAYFERTVVPPGIALIALMGISPLLRRRHDGLRRRRIAVASVVALATLALGLAAGMRNPVAIMCLVIASMTIGLVTIDLLLTIGQGGPGGWMTATVRTVRDRGRRMGGQLAHAGIALVLAGAAGSTLMAERSHVMLTPGQPVSTAGGVLRLERIAEVRGSNYTAAEALLTLTYPSGRVIRLAPQKRYYDKFPEATTEVAIRSRPAGDVYVALLGWNGRDQRVALQVQSNPLAIWIWIGAGLATLGGGLSAVARPRPRPIEQTAPAPTSAAHDRTLDDLPEPAAAAAAFTLQANAR